MSAAGPSRVQLALLRAVVPLELQEAFVGDLLEEFPRVRNIHGARRAGRWLWSQLARSLPALIALRLNRGGPMRPRRYGAAVLILLMGLLQAWDSRLLAGPPLAAALVAAGLALFVLTPVLAASARTAAVPLVLATGLVLAGRLVHGRSDLMLIAVIGVMVTLALTRFEGHRARPA